ncbi:MAG: KpsF/GutQ family sugar-phosphate isomerase [Pseudomonadota bacterium]
MLLTPERGSLAKAHEMTGQIQSIEQRPNDAADSKTPDSLTVGRRVLGLEAEGLTALADGLDQSFIDAVDLILAVTGTGSAVADGAGSTLGQGTGRVVVTGIGKSGHVARKIAATLASTGTPALFVHPAEASHGDLGMITPHDAVLALSNSGRMAELAALAPYVKRFKIPLIGITRDPSSPLAEQADIAILLPQVEEACPLHLAPTTSTTMTLALGDALAMALLEQRGFSADEFRVFHPGGALGQKLLRTHDLMHKGDALPLVPTATTMADAMVMISEKSFGCVGVIDGAGALLGIITDGDLRRHMAPDLLQKPVDEIMTKNPQTIRPSALAAEGLGIMNDRSITSLFVVEDGQAIGLLHVHDLLRAGVA